MTTYYKGKIFLASKNQIQHKMDVYVIDNRIIQYNDSEFVKLLNKDHARLYKYELADYITSILWKADKRNEYCALHQTLDDVYSQLPVDIQGEVDIIYEVVDVDNMTKYGKELITGLIFPLYEDTKLFEYSARLKDNRQKFFVPDATITGIYQDLYVLDSENEGYLRNALYKRIKRKIVTENGKNKIIYLFNGRECKLPIQESKLEEYELNAKTIFRDKNFMVCESLIKEGGLASQEDILEYMERTKNFREPINYQDFLLSLSQMNLSLEPIKIRMRK